MLLGFVNMTCGEIRVSVGANSLSITLNEGEMVYEIRIYGQASSEVRQNEFVIEKKEDGTVVLKGSKSVHATHVYIPEGVTEIADKAFSWCGELRKVVIPDTVKHIGKQAFADCPKRKRVIIQGGVKTIGDEAFANCEYLIHINIPESLTVIEERTFYNCPRLAPYVIIHEKVTRVAKDAFRMCSAERIDFNAPIDIDVDMIEYHRWNVYQTGRWRVVSVCDQGGGLPRQYVQLVPVEKDN